VTVTSFSLTTELDEKEQNRAHSMTTAEAVVRELDENTLDIESGVRIRGKTFTKFLLTCKRM
jgi:hypothetical protein